MPIVITNSPRHFTQKQIIQLSAATSFIEHAIKPLFVEQQHIAVTQKPIFERNGVLFFNPSPTVAFY